METGLTPGQELELLSSLESRAESPLKFAYTGEGYTRWIEFAQRSRADRAIEFEEDALKREAMPFLFRHVTADTQTVNIIDFGCGDGVPIAPVVQYLRAVPNIRYVPVDISSNMLARASKSVQSVLPAVETVPILFDFERGEIIEKILAFGSVAQTQNYFFLLGNTLGNFDNTDKILSNLKMSMFSNDHLIVGNQISNLLASPRLIEYYKTDEVFQLVASTLQRYGMQLAYDEFNVRWNATERQIEFFLSLNDDKHVTVASHTVSFSKGEEILLAISKKFVEESIVDAFSRTGFRIDLFTTNKQKDACIISATPSRYKS